ncbi:flippase [Pseudomonas sp. 5P_5.1_Bac1]|uniref:flippase n=1 Tax=Pseudomonas sp. 5P_5.1_Bac1 TaxID=2971616 RepID=UPI0021CA9782|nr:flippase [Pseudomonas sp. 5P_5.1_Bac1]MCU1722222.1 flippase [Pseudomonas sp. 5P_5.1_Bac1]
MSSVSRIIKSTALNLGGLGLPMIVAFFSIPYLIQMLGAEKFGLLALIWAVVSYVGIFDLGLGRALTLQVATCDAQERRHELGSILGTAYVLMLLLGGALAGVIFLAAPSIVALIKGVSDIREVEAAFIVMALSVPFIILTSGFKGLLEARQEFAKVNYVRLPLGIFTFAGPAILVFWFGARLDLIAIVLVIGRVIGCLAYFWFALGIARIEHRQLSWRNAQVRQLCVCGGWLSVGSVVSPIMGYADRFVLGILVSANAVAYYVTPNELVTKLWILPGALTAVLFPIFSGYFVGGAKKNAVELFDFFSMVIYLAVAPVSLVLAMFSYDLLQFWVGSEFAREGQHVLVIFAFAILVNCLAHVPLTLLQGTGSAKSVAVLQLIEVPLFLLALWVLTLKFGVVGAAWAWVLRALFDTAVMLKFATLKLEVSYWPRAVTALLGVLGLVLIYWIIEGGALLTRIFFSGLVCLAFAVVILRLFFKASAFKLKIQR